MLIDTQCVQCEKYKGCLKCEKYTKQIPKKVLESNDCTDYIKNIQKEMNERIEYLKQKLGKNK